MPTKRINQIILELPFEKKLIGAGALLMVVSLFLPWYADVDSFHTGNTFTGLTGPLYLAGLTFLVISSLSLLFIVTDHLGIKVPFAPLKSSKMYLGFGIFSFYLLMLVNSVYFDHNFGVNITMKESGFGMFTGFLSAALLTIGGYLNTRERSTAWKEFEEETRDHSMEVKMPASVQQKPRESLRTVHTDPVKKVSSAPASVASFEHLHATTAEAATPSEKTTSDETPPQSYRMDL